MLTVASRLRPLACAALFALAGCASPAAEPSPVADSAASQSVARMGVKGDLRPLFLTVYPQPREAEYGDTLYPYDAARRVDPGGRDFGEALETHGLTDAWGSLPSEGFLLLIKEDDDGQPLVLTAARDSAGLAWLRQALRQLTLDGPGGARVRECRIVDHPGFSLRGGSALAAWEGDYRANLSWGSAPGTDGVQQAIPVLAPESPLDATPFAIRATVRHLQDLQRRGAKRFALEFADAEFALTPETDALYDSYAEALVAYTRAVHDGLRDNDPMARLYLVPQTHWWNESRMRFFAAALRRSGLDGRVGLVMAGPEIGSRRIDADGLAAARRAFGLTETGAIVYDRAGGTANWGPVTGREAALRNDAEGVLSDRGTPVNRLTRLDWAWNPEAYRPESSWKRAVFELAGPHGFRALADACLAFRKQLVRAEAAVAIERFAAQDLAGWEGPVPQGELVRLLRRDLVRLPAQEPKPPSAAK